MAWVSEEVTDILRKKDQGLIDGAEAMVRLLREVRDQVIVELSHVPEGEFDAWRLRKVLDSIRYSLDRFGESAVSTASGLLDDAWGLGADLVDAYAGASGVAFGFGELPQSVLDVMKEFTFGKIRNLEAAAWDRIRGEITLGVLGQKTPHEVMQSIVGQVDRPSVFGSIENRAEVITKTEMGRAFSRATFERLKQAEKAAPGMMKEWRHRGHPKEPRPSHLWADGNRVPVGEPFSIGGVSMMYPRDPTAPLSEVINCG